MQIGIKETNINVITGTSLKSNDKRKTIFFSKNNKTNNSKSASLELSTQAKLMSKNSTAYNNASVYKKSGTTGSREEWEDSELDRTDYHPTTGIFADMHEVMRLDDPETYEECKALEEKGNSYGFATDGERKYHTEESHKFWNWFQTRCMKNGWYDNPIKYHTAVKDTLEGLYSDGQHDTKFNFYGENEDDPRATMWNPCAKFNVLLSVQAFNKLASPKDVEGRNSMVTLIDDSVRNMKELEKTYEGDKEHLRFGVKIDKDENISYWANYKGCKNKNGISSDDPNTLLKMLAE
jgi:hypothetical protein